MSGAGTTSERQQTQRTQAHDSDYGQRGLKDLVTGSRHHTANTEGSG